MPETYTRDPAVPDSIPHGRYLAMRRKADADAATDAPFTPEIYGTLSGIFDADARLKAGEDQ